MSELITISKDIWKRLSAQKGQGLVEFALVLAFCAGIGVAAREAGFAEAISNLLDRGEQTEDVAAVIGGPPSVDRLKYRNYLINWGKKTSDELAAIRNEERITGDQRGLVAIAETFLGKSANEVQDQMKIFANTYGGCPAFMSNSVNLNYIKAQSGSDGWSKELVPLAYKNFNNQDKDTTGYIWLEARNYVNTIDYMTGAQTPDGPGDGPKAETYNKPGKDVTSQDGVLLTGSSNKTVSVDRLFYSDDMIASDDRAVILQVHYNSETNMVDKVHIVARLGNGDQANSATPAQAAKGLDITVSGSTSDPRYIVNN